MSEQQVYVRFPEDEDTGELTAMYKRNREFFEKFSPSILEEFYTEEYQLDKIMKSKADRAEDRKYDFVVCHKEDDRIIGSIGLSFVARGSLQSCMIGYSLDQAYNGKGYMTEAVKQVVRYAFEVLKFHRITGEVSPRNPGSIRVLENAGFHKEGISRSNVKINGVWEDHQVLALINPSEQGEMHLPEEGEVLTGGNINHVVKVGETVRREAAPNPYVYELLKHLEREGYSFSPRYLGQDDKGREILSYLEGVVPGNNYPEIEVYMWSDEVLIELAKLLRSYHNATAGFTTSAKSVNAYPKTSLHEVVCHNDAALYNVVFRDELPVGIIDFDMAGPGPRLWDIAYTLYTSVPLAAFSPSEEDRVVGQYNKESHASVRKRRIDLFFNAYGMDVPADLKEWVISRIQFMCTTLSDRAAGGDPAFVKLVEEGHLAHYEQEVRFLERHFDDWS